MFSKLLVFLAAFTLAYAAFAGGNTGPSNQNGPTFGGGGSAEASAKAVGVGVGVGVGIGGDGGTGGAGGTGIGGAGGTGVGGGGGSSQVDIKTRAYGAGSTGLTSTASCLGSMSVAFNAIATTYIVQHCVLMKYAELLCGTDKACWRRVALVDENLTDEQRTALGIAKPVSVPTAKNMADNPYSERTPVAFTQGQ